MKADLGRRVLLWCLLIVLLSPITTLLVAGNYCQCTDCTGFNRAVVRSRSKGACYRIDIELDGERLTEPIYGCYYNRSLEDRVDEKLTLLVSGYLVVAASQCSKCSCPKYRAYYFSNITTAEDDYCSWEVTDGFEVSWTSDGRMVQYPEWCNNRTCPAAAFEKRLLADQSLCDWYTDRYEEYGTRNYTILELTKPARDFYPSVGAGVSIFILVTGIGAYEIVRWWKRKHRTAPGAGFGDSFSSAVSAHSLRIEFAAKKGTNSSLRAAKKDTNSSLRAAKKGTNSSLRAAKKGANAKSVTTKKRQSKSSIIQAEEGNEDSVVA